jgi:hypothetical protein
MSSQIATEFPAIGATRVRIGMLGRHAQRAADGGDAEVIARFERSAYVRAASGRLACIGGDSLGLGPLNALTTSAEFERARLAVGARVCLDTGAATRWRPPEFAVPAAGTGSALATLDTALATVAPRGLADPVSSDAVSARARRGLSALTAWIVADGCEPPEDILLLIGLGPGLTPAGDDALGGAMIVLRGFGRRDLAERLAVSVLPRIAERTSAISAAHLEAAAEGEGAAALHDTLAALANAHVGAAVEGLRRLDRIGHSSGWDALAGAAAALRGLC